jgi:hypothetical protein
MPKTPKTSETPSWRRRDTHIPTAQKEMWRYKFGELMHQYGMVPGFQRVMEQRRESGVVGVKKIGTMKLCMKMLIHVGVYRGMLGAYFGDGSRSTICILPDASSEGDITSFQIKKDRAIDFLKFLLENIMEFKVDWKAFHSDDKQIGLDMEERAAHLHGKKPLKGPVKSPEVAECVDVWGYNGSVKSPEIGEYADVWGYNGSVKSPEIGEYADVWAYNVPLWTDCGDVFESPENANLAIYEEVMHDASENVDIAIYEPVMHDTPTKPKYAGGFQGSNWRTLCNTIRSIGYAPDTSIGARRHAWRDAFKGVVPFCLIQPKGSLVELDHYYI